MSKHAYDFIIVGGGSAGSTLAARLSEKPAHRVLLLEAGAFYPQRSQYPEIIARAGSYALPPPGTPHMWFFPDRLPDNRTGASVRGKVIGGSSAVNGTYFIRGRRGDFDGFAALGNDEWSFDRVLPFYKSLETDNDICDEFHGKSGPVPIHRTAERHYRPITRAFVESCHRLGFGFDDDKNNPNKDGVGPIPRNCVDQMRMNMGINYLLPNLARPNLTIMGQTLVRRVLFDGTTAIGVEVQREGKIEQIFGGEIVLCAGAIKSPHILMLSGVGPAEQLRQHGIDVVVDNPNVGQNLMDHPSISVYYEADQSGDGVPEHYMRLQTCLSFTAPGSNEVSDVQITCDAGSATEPATTLRFMCFVMTSKGRGMLELQSADPETLPVLNYRCFSEPSDLSRLRSTVRQAVAFLDQPSFRAMAPRRKSPDDDDLRTDADLDRWILRNMYMCYHTTSTVRMGPASDPLAAVDQYGRVRGAKKLRVMDISILPSTLSRGPSATAVMVAERGAAFF